MSINVESYSELLLRIATLQRELAEQRGAHQRAAHVVRDLQRELAAAGALLERAFIYLHDEPDEDAEQLAKDIRSAYPQPPEHP